MDTPNCTVGWGVLLRICIRRRKV